MAATSRESLRWIPAVLFAVTLLYLGAAVMGWLPSDFRPCRGMVLLFGVFTLSGIMIRPAWFWNSRRARWGRAALGDRLYAALLSAVALGLIYMALAGRALDKCNV
jgi:ABC-type dipeptide/oligopeptide/nickel transport system permease component